MVQVFASAPGYGQLTMTLPFGVDAGKASAELEDDNAKLLLRMPYKPYSSCVEEASPAYLWLITMQGSIWHQRITCKQTLSLLYAGKAGNTEAAGAPFPGQSLDGAGRVNLTVSPCTSPARVAWC